MSAPTQRQSGTAERPLPPSARVSLVLAAAWTMLAFYATALLLIPLLLVGLLALAVVAVGAARFGILRFVTPMMEPPSRVLTILVRQFWLPAAVEYRIPLSQSDAPRFFAMAGDLARRLGVRPPTSVVVEMHCGAWVNLRGFRRAAGKSTLGIGFDLLAGLTAVEVEAVLAHELAHARLVQRGFSRWLNKGLARLANVSRQLTAYHLSRKNAGERSDLAEWASNSFDKLTVRAARLVATYSRQDEFDADRTAAEVCGAFALRSALIRLHALDDAAARLPWNERFARLQGKDFSQWLVGEFATLMKRIEREPARHAIDPYSTHPNLRHRLAALPVDDRPAPDGPVGVELLAKPNDVAARLVAEIQRVAAVQEVKDSRTLARETRKYCRRTGSRAWGIAGVGAIGIAAVVAVFGVFPWEDGSLGAALSAAVLLAFGLIFLFATRHRDGLRLPVPEFGTLTSRITYPSLEAMGTAEKTLTEQYQVEVNRHSKKAERFRAALSACYQALGDRDYLRAHVTARLALRIEAESVEACIGYAIAAASLGNTDQTQRAIATVRRIAGVTTPNTLWGIAWALTQLPDWSAEGLLQRVHRNQPGVATFAALLALAQLSRGKIHSAIGNARTAVRLAPANETIRHLLIDTLLAAGNAREAARVAKGRGDGARPDTHTALQMVRLHLMLQDRAAADRWAEILCDVAKGSDDQGQWLVALGVEFHRAREDEVAQRFYIEAVTTPFHAHANIGLAGLAQGAGDRTRAREHLLAALYLENVRLRQDETPGQLFHNVIGRLVALEERRVQCRAWVGAIPGTATSPLAGTSLLVFAPDLAAAQAHLGEITSAMQKKGTSFDLSSVSWNEASAEHQPVRPVAPGVQFVMQ